jgi:hypothetical protein
VVDRALPSCRTPNASHATSRTGRYQDHRHRLQPSPLPSWSTPSPVYPVDDFHVGAVDDRTRYPWERRVYESNTCKPKWHSHLRRNPRELGVHGPHSSLVLGDDVVSHEHKVVASVIIHSSRAQGHRSQILDSRCLQISFMHLTLLQSH